MERVQKQHEEVNNTSHNKSIVIIAENIRTPENVGMIIRLAEAFAVKEIFFTGTLGVELTTKVKRASRNTYQKVKFNFINNSLQAIEEIRAEQYQLIALEITKESRSIQSVNF